MSDPVGAALAYLLFMQHKVDDYVDHRANVVQVVEPEPSHKPKDPAPKPKPTPTPTPSVETFTRTTQSGPSAYDWQQLRECESGNTYTIATGNGYYGAYQFSLSTWQSMGGTGLPSNASPDEQDYRAQRLYGVAGASPWPVCGQYLG